MCCEYFPLRFVPAVMFSCVLFVKMPRPNYRFGDVSLFGNSDKTVPCAICCDGQPNVSFYMIDLLYPI